VSNENDHWAETSSLYRKLVGTEFGFGKEPVARKWRRDPSENRHSGKKNPRGKALP